MLWPGMASTHIFATGRMLVLNGAFGAQSDSNNRLNHASESMRTMLRIIIHSIKQRSYLKRCYSERRPRQCWFFSIRCLPLSRHHPERSIHHKQGPASLLSVMNVRACIASGSANCGAHCSCSCSCSASFSCKLEVDQPTSDLGRSESTIQPTFITRDAACPANLHSVAETSETFILIFTPLYLINDLTREEHITRPRL